MSQPVRSTFRSLSWEETPVGQADALPKLTRATCAQEYTGDIEGRSTLEYLMVHTEGGAAGGAATFVGMERVVGSMAGRDGSFALRHEGVFEGGVAKMTVTVVDGSGTGSLGGVRGAGSFASAQAESYEITLHCDFVD